MKGKNTLTSWDSSHEVTVVNGHAMVKYTQDISYGKLLDIFWIPKNRSDIIRSLINENRLSYNPSNGILALENGRPIPTGYLIKLPTRMVSAKVIQEAEDRNKPKAPAVSQTETRTTKVSTGIRDEIGELLQDKTVRYSLFGWTAIIAIAVSVWVASILSEDVPKKKRYKPPVAEIATNDKEVPLSKTSSPKTTGEPPLSTKDPQTPDKIDETAKVAQKADTKKKADSKEEQTVVYLGKERVDMREVGTLVITPNSKSDDIRALLKAFNAANPPREKSR